MLYGELAAVRPKWLNG